MILILTFSCSIYTTGNTRIDLDNKIDDQIYGGAINLHTLGQKMLFMLYVLEKDILEFPNMSTTDIIVSTYTCIFLTPTYVLQTPIYLVQQRRG